jgi:oligoribonuclease NrnB/cAMP/cGMP phosphodiesterase (DHH superfamily)
VTLEKRPLFVHIISHGPHCLDGVAAAVAIARARPQAEVIPWFVHNNEVNDAVHDLRCAPADAAHEIWIADVSWSDRQADRHLRSLAERGARIFWVDHHRTAIERRQAGEVRVPFAACVVSERFAASRLVYEYLRQQPGGGSRRFRNFLPVVERADDTDRWIHRIDGSHRLALTVRAMGSIGAYEDLLEIDRDITYTPRMRAACERAAQEVQRSREMAERESFSLRLPSGLTLVTSVCLGYPSEVADAWGKHSCNAIFALYDTRHLAVSLRRSPDCGVDLSHLARRFGGGGHPAAAGCELPWVGGNVARGIADILAPVLARGID